ncbi:ubiquitin carboxyl-terminal hydrolase 8 [Trichomonascus vanleenenianus]|uniref:ubiquitin-specific protease UBP8 n=1 Tax=Trichomonascus vanleenenianus TaxID=2268995 RepID=UPI003ECA60CD
MASGCIHTRQARTKEILQAYKLAVRLAQSINSKVFVCINCHEVSPVRVCLECAFVGCTAHGSEHSHENETGHNLGVDVNGEGLVWCYQCGDYVLDETFEAVRNMTTTKTHNPTPKIKNIGVVPPYQATTGLRGFCNMGATCFISVILQSFVHNPIVRNFFLAGGHDRNQCKAGDSCLACCVDEIFEEFFKSSSVQGFGPTNMLIASWKANRQLAGASEQDAHEFFQFILDEFHKAYNSGILSKVDKLDKRGSTPDLSCGCVSHRTFCGELESRIQCQECGNITNTVDPMMDLSLEIKKRSSATLEDCLERFTSTERLDSLYYCSKCNTRRPVDKQLRVKHLPIVLSIQLKRFEHTSATSSTKIESSVEYPLYIDMGKYTSDGRSGLVYELFGVVCHQGSMHTGHYTCYMKDRQSRWYYFDDTMVTAVAPRQVLAAKSTAYLLFYIVERL